MRVRLSAEATYRGRRYALSIEELELGGRWEAQGYRGSFRVERGLVEIRVPMGSILKALRGGASRRGGSGALEELARGLGVRIVVRGPLGVKLLEAGPPGE